MRKIKEIIVHCSDSDFGDTEVIREWHMDPDKIGGPFTDVGYHFVITNGYSTYRAFREQTMDIIDGQVQKARPLEIVGAHCRGKNRGSVGICLIGIDEFTNEQYKAFIRLVLDLMDRKYCDIKPENIKGHYEYDKKKTCPNIEGGFLRKIISDALNDEEIRKAMKKSV